MFTFSSDDSSLCRVYYQSQGKLMFSQASVILSTIGLVPTWPLLILFGYLVTCYGAVGTCPNGMLSCLILKFGKVKHCACRKRFKKGKVHSNLHSNVAVLFCIKGRVSNRVSTAPCPFQVTASSSNKKFDLSTKALCIKGNSEAGHATNILIPLKKWSTLRTKTILRGFIFRNHGSM